MSFRTAVANQHFNYKEEQGNSQKIHELLIIFLENNAAVHFVLHPADVVNNRIKTKFAVPGPDI